MVKNSINSPKFFCSAMVKNNTNCIVTQVVSLLCKGVVMKCNEMKCNEMKCNAMEWNAMKWNGILKNK